MVAPLVAAAGRAALDIVARNAATIVTAVAGVAAVTTLVTRAINRRRPFSEIVAGNLVFPEDLENYGISLSFQFAKYERRSIYIQPFERRLGKIRLPVPRQIVDRLDANWEETANESIIGAAIESTLKEVQSQPAGSSRSLADILSSIGAIVADTAGGTGVAAATSILTQANVPGLTLNTALQPLGLATNPFLTVLFKQPQFKKHSFSWTLAPKTPEEAATVNAIIQTFRYHMLPDRGKDTGGTLLDYPDMVHIRFFNNDSFLYRFKPCVITSLSVDYAPEGPSFFKGSSNVPSQVKFSIELMEIEYWLKDSFQEEMKTIQGIMP